MKTKDPIAEADDDIAYSTGAIARAGEVLDDIRSGYYEPLAEKHGEAIGGLAAERVELEYARKNYLDALGEGDSRSAAPARKKVADQAAHVAYYEEDEKAAADAEAEITDLIKKFEKYIRRLREDLAKAKESHAGALAAHEQLQAAIVQEIETLSPGFAEGAVPIARLWEAVLTAGHVGFVYQGRVPDGAEYRYTKAKAALVEAGRMIEAKGVLKAADAKARALALLD
jgi:hypothetical protein